MEGLQARVYNEPQADGTVIQYDLRRHEIDRFESDKACAAAMGIEIPSDIPPVREELREGAAHLFGKISHNVLGERPHAA